MSCIVELKCHLKARCFRVLSHRQIAHLLRVEFISSLFKSFIKCFPYDLIHQNVLLKFRSNFQQFLEQKFIA